VKESDDAWLDALRGNTQPDDAAESSSAEGAMLRTALKARGAPLAAQLRLNEDMDPSREDALISRAVREGLIGASSISADAERVPRSAETARPSLHTRYLGSLLAAAATVVLAVGTTWWLQQPHEVAEVMRGSEPVILHADDPAELKQRLLADLREAGVQAIGYEALGAQGIDADLPLPVSPAVRRVLSSQQIPTPEDGVLRIEIRESQ
jgi:hypothetical protein